MSSPPKRQSRSTPFQGTLTSSQRHALSQLRELTNGADDDASIGVLKSVGWDIQRATELIFESQPVPSTSQIQPFEIDESEVIPPPTLPVAQFQLGRILAFPFHILTTFFRFLFFGLLRVRSGHGGGRMSWSLGLNYLWNNLFRARVEGNGDRMRGYGEPWIRALEEETGAVWIGDSEGVVMDWEDDSKKYLPPFEVGTYEEFLKKCVGERKVGCVVLVSEEHEDVKWFKRGTMVDRGFVRKLDEGKVICWGGDVKDREVWSAAEKLEVTTYPFVAFLAVQPRRGRQVLTVLSRHQGRTMTSADKLVRHLERDVLPRVQPFLETLEREERGLERDRALRAEQDRAYEESRRRDRERWEDEQREKERLEREEREKKEKEKRRKEIERMVWRVGKKSEEVRVVIRMPDGERIVEMFGKEESVGVLYAVVHRLLAGERKKEEEGNISEKELDELIGKEGGKNFWGFKMVTAYPRKEIEWKQGKIINLLDLPGQLVVERDYS